MHLHYLRGVFDAVICIIEKFAFFFLLVLFCFASMFTQRQLPHLLVSMAGHILAFKHAPKHRTVFVKTVFCWLLKHE